MMDAKGFWIMLVSMVFAGLLSSMNVWADSWSDIRWHLNDMYMIGLMTGWMFAFMGLFYWHIGYVVFGLLLASICLYMIRNQVAITEIEYLRGMIPHHSMAVMMSKRLSEKPNTIQSFVNQIIKTQEMEIRMMKEYLK